MTEACIVGWAHSPFGKLDDPDVEALIGRVARAAIEDAGIAPAEIEAVFVSLFNNGFSRAGFSVLAGAAERAGTALHAEPRATRTPAPPARPRCTARATSSRPGAAGSRW